MPNFNERTLHLISGDFGPFEAGSPVQIPLWFAMHLKGKHKCSVVVGEIKIEMFMIPKFSASRMAQY